MKYVIYAILILVLWLLIKKVLSVFKIPKLNNLVLVDGGVKTGKSTMSVHFSISQHKKTCRSIKFKNFFRKLFKKELIQLPVLYSNVPLAYPYVPVTRDLLTMKVKPIDGSIVYLQEGSLIADSQLIKDKAVNNDLLLFFKLCGHIGVQVIIDTQSISDLHYSVKRCLSEYYYIHHLVKVPFFLIAFCIENRYSDDGTILTTENEDIEQKLKKVIIPKRVWKYFDCRAFSEIVADKPVYADVVDNNLQTQDLKVHNLVSFRPEFNFLFDKKNNDKGENKNV